MQKVIDCDVAAVVALLLVNGIILVMRSSSSGNALLERVLRVNWPTVFKAQRP